MTGASALDEPEGAVLPGSADDALADLTLRRDFEFARRFEVGFNEGINEKACCQLNSRLLNGVVAWGGIEPPTQGFSIQPNCGFWVPLAPRNVTSFPIFKV